MTLTASRFPEYGQIVQKNPTPCPIADLASREGLKAAEGGHGLLHPQAYDTLNEIPE
jgi:hypothetical protein